MKWWIVKIEFVGLTGKYQSSVEVRARDAGSAEKKAAKVIGNRDGWVVSVQTLVDAAQASLTSIEQTRNKILGVAR